VREGKRKKVKGKRGDEAVVGAQRSFSAMISKCIRCNHWGAGAVVLALVCALGPRAAALSMPLITKPSLEWQVEQAELVVRGTVRPGMQRDVKVQGALWREVTLDVEETIKGAKLEQVTFVTTPIERLEGTANSWADVLVFLNWRDDGVRTNVTSAGLGAWVASGDGPFVLGPNVGAMWRMDGSKVPDGEALLKAVRESAAFAKARGGACEAGRFRSDQLSGGGIIVPKDGRLQALAERLLRDPAATQREVAIDLLGQMKSPTNLGLLREMLKDPDFEVSEGSEWTPRLDERSWRIFPVRRAAAWALGSNSLEGLIEPQMRYAAAPWRGWAVALGVIFGAAVLWPRRWGEIGIGGRVTIVALGLMAIVAVFWWRSGRVGETYSFAGGGADYEIASLPGRLGVLRVQDSAPPHGVMARRFDLDPDRRVFWFEPSLKATEVSAWRGFYEAQGRTGAVGSYSYRLIALPYWAVVAALGVWPVVWGMGRLRRARRRRRWLATNHCGRCGYDLRGHTGEGRCPECGEENAPKAKRRQAGVVAGWMIVGLVMAAWGGEARAAIMRISLSSVELRVAEADVVVRGRMAPVFPGVRLWRVDVSEVIKGKLPSRILLNPDSSFVGGMDDLVGVDCVFCLRPHSDGEYVFLSLKPDKYGDYRFLSDSLFPPWRLDGGEQLAIMMDGRRLRDGVELLEHVRAEARRTAIDAENRSRTVLEADDFPIESPLGSMRNVRGGALRVPVDERLERMAREWCDDPEPLYRAQGARLLRLFRKPEHLPTLRRLMWDPAYEVIAPPEFRWEESAWRMNRRYFVRAAARATLDSWEIEEPTVVLGPHQTYEPLAWPKWFAGFGGIMITGALIQRQRGWVMGAVRWGLVALAVSVSVLDWRSDRSCDLASWVSGGIDYELASAGGKISLVWVADGAAEQQPLVESVAWNQGQAHQPWYVPLLTPEAESKRIGFGSSRGRVNLIAPSFRYQRIEAPHVAVVGGLLLVPIIGWLVALRRVVRRWGWKGTGRCQACGYDLRCSSGRCPECGVFGIVRRIG
jgi:hypothetical protein